MESRSYLCSPLCLENICRINLLFRLEEYPVQQLLLLPPSIRRYLPLGLSPVDILHYEAAGLFHDFDTASVVESARKKLLDYTFGTDNMILLPKLVIPSILPSLVYEQQLQGLSLNNLLKYFSVTYSSLPVAVISDEDVIIPNRLNSFVNVTFCDTIGTMHFSSPDGAKPLEQMLQYCHCMAPNEFKIDLYNFVDNQLSDSFTFDKVGRNFLIAQDPKLPFLQSFLAQIETVELGSTKLFSDFDKSYCEVYSLYQATLCVLLYNMITGPHPFLEHIKIYGMRSVIEMILSIVNKFFSDGRYDDSPSVYPLVLASAPAPYHLKGLSITHDLDEEQRSQKLGINVNLNSRECEGKISNMTKDIVLFQLSTLEHVKINCGKGFCYCLRDRDGMKTKQCFAEQNYMIPEYRQLLSALTDLLKQPQLQSLSVGRAPLTEAYQMIEVFLCTETTHTLSLTIEGVEEGSMWWKSDTEWRQEDDIQPLINVKPKNRPKCNTNNLPTCTLPPPSPHSLPDSNGALKSLDIGCSCDGLHTWLFTIPNLQLKEMKTSRPHLVPSDSPYSF